MSEPHSIWKKDIIGWSLYDFANTIYSMNIVSLYLKRYIIEDLGYQDSWFDIPFSISMAIAAITLPALGALSDQSTKKKLFLFLFTLTCCIAVGLMSVVPSSLIFISIFLFIIANFAYEAGQPFYNTLLYSVAEGREARYISGIGVACGYVGSVLGMVLVLPFVSGEIFGWNISFIDGWGKTGSFIPTAVLFMLFALPLFLWVKEKPYIKTKKKKGIRAAYKDVWDGISQTKKYPGVLRYLIADYFFEDAVATVILNIGLYCSIVLTLSDSEITTFLIISTISAVFGSFIIGKFAQVWSLKKMMTLIIYGWVGSLLLFIMTDSMTIIWIIGSLVGILMGGLWTVSRPLLAELVPCEELGRFFGLFSLSGRAAAVIGPLIWTTIVYLFNPERSLGRFTVNLLDIEPVNFEKLPYKMGVVSLVIMMIIGLIIFRKVPHTRINSDG